MKKLIALPLAVLLCACGSDSDTETIPPTVTEPTYSNLDVHVQSKEVFDGEITVYLGRWRNCEYYPQYCTTEGKNMATPDDSQYIIKVRAEDLKQKFPKSINSDLFQQGHYSALDVLRYIGETRPDIEFKLGEFNDEIGTYDFTVSWDRNGDGLFDSNDNIDAESNVNSPNWYARFIYGQGDVMRDGGQASLEVLYERLDELPVRNDLILRFESFSQAMTERRQTIQKNQVKRLNKYGGVVLPELIANFNDGAGDVILAKNISVKPYEFRSDIFKAGTITGMDMLMSVHDSGQAKLGFNYWPTLLSNATVGNYAVTSVNEQRSEGLVGWLIRVGEKETFNDFFDPNPLNKGAGIVPNIIAAGDKYCPWTLDSDQHTWDSAMLCYEEWGNGFGGAYVHIMSDTWVTRYSVGAIHLNYFNAMPMAFKPSELNSASDGKYPVHDINKAVAPLTDKHFGWKVADCGMCHSLDNIHLNGDSPALPDTIEPYFCASCHGNNGATLGHGETARCFWCHSKDLKMPNHGDASIERTIGDIACVDPQTGEPDATKMGPCATVSYLPAGTILPQDNAGNFESEFADVKYSDKISTLGNSDWHTSVSFPDPYSCVTCHVNP